MGWWGEMEKDQLSRFNLSIKHKKQDHIRNGIWIFREYFYVCIPSFVCVTVRILCVYFHACELLFTQQRCQSMTSIHGGQMVQSCRGAGVSKSRDATCCSVKLSKSKSFVGWGLRRQSYMSNFSGATLCCLTHFCMKASPVFHPVAQFFLCARSTMWI